MWLWTCSRTIERWEEWKGDNPDRISGNSLVSGSWGSTGIYWIRQKCRYLECRLHLSLNPSWKTSLPRKLHSQPTWKNTLLHRKTQTNWHCLSPLLHSIHYDRSNQLQATFSPRMVQIRCSQTCHWLSSLNAHYQSNQKTHSITNSQTSIFVILP